MATGMVRTDSVPAAERSAAGLVSRLAVWTPYLLAILFGLWSLRGAGSPAPVDTDAARHAMNGVFVHDLVMSGRLAHPIEFGKEYYGKLPALSMPYHPPAFPVFESLFFFLFGVKLLSARLAVAVAVGVCTVLLYRLVRYTHCTAELAACVTVSMLSLLSAQAVGTEVMLEFPALAFALAALYCLRDLDRGYPLGRALLFAVFASASVWTKQHGVFLGAVPPLCALMTGRWRLLFGKAMWISSAIFAGAVAALIRISAPFQETGVNEVSTTAEDARWVLLNNLGFYSKTILAEMVGLPGLFAAVTIIFLVIAFRKKTWRTLRLGLYLAWAVAMLPVLLLVGSYNERYLFFALPALLVIGYVAMFQGAAAIFGEQRAGLLPLAFTALWLIAGLFFHPQFLHGPGEAAAVVMRKPGRVVYCGDADGNFVFAVRALDPNLKMTVVSGEKLPDSAFTADTFETFCRRHGIEWVVLENTPNRAKWDVLRGHPAPSMKLQDTIPLDSSRSRWHGNVQVYRFTAGSQSDSGLDIEIPKIGGKVEVKP